MTQQNVIVSGRKTDGLIRAIKTDENGALDTYLQDQTTPIYNFYVKQLQNSATIATNTIIDTNTVILQAGHGFVTGNYISLLENNYVYQGKVTNVVTNTLTLEAPLDYAFTTSATVRRTTVTMNVDGSSTRQIFNIVPIAGQIWDIISIIFLMEDTDTMDTAKFGGITALTNGIVLRKKYDANHYKNIFAIHSNGEFELCNGVTNYQAKAPSGVYGFTSKHTFGGQSNYGAVIRIDGTKGDELQIVIQDNLTGLSTFKSTVQLHEVQN